MAKPSKELLATVADIPTAFAECRKEGRHMFKAYTVDRRGSQFEVWQQCKVCDTLRQTFRSANDGSRLDGGRYRYPEGYKIEGQNVSDVRNTLWLQDLLEMEIAAQDGQQSREEPAIPQRKRRNGSRGKKRA